jgi:two-component system, chemotaxis family, CheB/CheR fusion protein
MMASKTAGELTTLLDYEAADLRNAVLLIRGGTMLVMLLQGSYLAADLYRGNSAVLIDLLSVALGSIAFAATYAKWFTRHWRLLPIKVSIAEIALTAFAAMHAGDPGRVLVSVLLYSCGTASLVPWSPIWQQSLNFFCVLVLLFQRHALAAQATGQLDIWIPVMVAVGIGQFATTFGERHRRQLRESAVALKESEQRFRSMVDEVRDYAIFMLDPNLVIVSWNAGAERIYGYAAAEVLGRSSAMFLTEEGRRGAPERAFRTAIDQGRFEEEAARVRKDGTRFLGNIVMTALRDESGNLFGFVEIVRDITEKKKADDERLQLIREQEARAQAELALAARDEFLAILSHELRNPLGAISNALALLQRKATDRDTSVRAVEIASRQTDKLTRLVNDLLDLSRITSGKVKLERVAVNVRHTVDKAIQSFRTQAMARQSNIDVVAPDFPVLADADPVRLEQIVTNLLDNASKFTNPGGHIAVEIERRDNYVILSVADDGIGIQSDMVDRIFTPFIQGETGRRGSSSGLGLGLAIVKRLVEQHGGEISVHSDGIGHGSRFTISLPLATATSEYLPPAELHLEARQTIVIADDHDDSLASLRDVLEAQGHRIVTAPDGSAAVIELMRHRPAVAIIDIDMPGLSGHEVAMRVRKEPWAQSMLLIALTGHGFERDHSKSLEAGFDAHLQKPVDLSELARLIREHSKNCEAKAL